MYRVRMASLIGSKVGQNEWKATVDRVEKVRHAFLPFRAKISHDVGLANSRAPGVCFVLVFINVADFGRNVATGVYA